MIDNWSRTAEQIMLAAIESKVRVLAITSATPAAGVSTVSAGLAAALARSGRNTLLIDLTAPINADTHAAGWAPGEPLSADAILVTDANLATLTVAPTTANQALFSNVDLLQKAFQRDLAAYAHVIIDLPAMQETDAARLSPVAAARAADAVVLVALTGLTGRAELAEASHHLRQVGANLSGLVLNDQYCATLGEEIADVSYRRLGGTFPRMAHWIAQKAMATPYLGRNFRIVR